MNYQSQLEKLSIINKAVLEKIGLTALSSMSDDGAALQYFSNFLTEEKFAQLKEYFDDVLGQDAYKISYLFEGMRMPDYSSMKYLISRYIEGGMKEEEAVGLISFTFPNEISGSVYDRLHHDGIGRIDFSNDPGLLRTPGFGGLQTNEPARDRVELTAEIIADLNERQPKRKTGLDEVVFGKDLSEKLLHALQDAGADVSHAAQREVLPPRFPEVSIKGRASLQFLVAEGFEFNGSSDYLPRTKSA